MKSANLNFFSRFLFLGLSLLIFMHSGVEASMYSSNILDNTEKNEWIELIKKENITSIKTLIEAKKNPNERITKEKYTPLMAAAYKGNVEIMKLLVEAGAKLELTDMEGNTAIMYSLIEKEKVKALEYLIGVKAKVEVRNDTGKTPLIVAAMKGYVKSIELLLNAGAKTETLGFKKRTAFMEAAAMSASLDTLEALVARKANVNARDVDSFTAVMWAAFDNSATRIRNLAEVNADLNLRSTKAVSVQIKKSHLDFFGRIETIPKGSSALDIARQLKCEAAENALTSLGAKEK